jgi:hypothetical protein
MQEEEEDGKHKEPQQACDVVMLTLFSFTPGLFTKSGTKFWVRIFRSWTYDLLLTNHMVRLVFQ